MADAIKIQGLNEFRRGLKSLDRDLPKALRLAFNQAANVVVADALPRIPVRTGRARNAVRALSTQTKSRVAGGGRIAPYYPWLDFGGRVGRNRSVSRSRPRHGRYIYDAYFRKRDSGEFEAMMSKALIQIARSAGIEVTGGH